MTDENPILRSLLDSLTAFNRRLSIIETSLLPPSATSQTAPKQGGIEYGNGPGWNTGSSTSQWPLSKCVPSSASSTSSASSPSCIVRSALHPPPGNVAIPFIDQSWRHDQPRQYKRLRLQHEHIKEEDFRVEGTLLAREVRPADSDEDNDAQGGKDEEGDEDKKNSPFEEQSDGQPGRTGATTEANSSQEPQPADAGDGRLEALPEGFLITGRATLQEELDGWTLPRGYSMRINGTRSHGRRQKIRMVCFRGGRSRLRPKEEVEQRDRETENNGAGATGASGNDYYDQEHNRHGPSRRRQRKPTTDRVSKKCECPFRFELVEVCPGADRYAVHYTNDDHRRHNHAAADLMLDPRARKLPAALKNEVDQWLRGARSMYSTDSIAAEGEAGSAGGPWTIAKIQAELQRRGYGHVLDFDLRNRKRALLHKERMAAQLKSGSGSSALAGGAAGNSSRGLLQ